MEGINKINNKATVDKYLFRTECIFLWLKDACKPGMCNRHPSFVLSNSFSNQTLAQIDLWTNNTRQEFTGFQIPR